MKRKIILITSVFLIIFLNCENSLFSKTFPFGLKNQNKDNYEFFNPILGSDNFEDYNDYGPIDVLHYRIETNVYPLSKVIVGKTTIFIRCTGNNLSNFRLDFEGLNVISVKLDGFDAIYQYDSQFITITTDETMSENDEFQVEISYEGEPEMGFYFTKYSIYSNTEPRQWTDHSWSRYWFPCKAVPWDKATSETITRVPENMNVASNGLLIDIIPDEENNQVVYHWLSNDPVSTYLICIAISDYYTFTDYYGDMELQYFVYPQMKDIASFEFSDIPDMIYFYSENIYPYPFEKYGMAVTEISGGMENQTITTIGSHLVTGYKVFNWLYAHELAHQWWGDLVTLTDWKEIWLNEGFATYFDALYTEYSMGKLAFHSRLEDFKIEYFYNLEYEDFPIYAPDFMWGATVYQKGALVLHMLRNVIGDENFWFIMKRYAREFAYSNSTIKDFIEICEDVSKQDLGWFFEQWIYDKGHPEYNLGWFSKKIDEKKYAVEVIFHQTQMNSLDYPIYKMPFMFEFLMPENSDYDSQIHPLSVISEEIIDNEFEKFSFTLDFKPDRFKPDSDRLSLRKMFILPEYIPPRYGNVGLEFERIENILTINGTIGNEERELAVLTGEPFKLEITNPSYVKEEVLFVVYAKFDDCSSIDKIAILPSDIGSFCFSIPPIGGDAIVVANNLGFDDILGTPLFESRPAPSTIIDAPSGFNTPLTITFQALILDPCSKSGISVTNAIVLRVLGEK